MKSEKTPWHALYVHSRAEKKVYERLVEMGFEASPAHHQNETVE